ncbi:amidohydrolase [Rhizohabitans arisaemae]|uniref:amidohydrolase n=1 Tax=Rhizohabitans arisaemae TaxID=2720610 RepID=UPI0024B09C95|nr:amidohydrolase family protein [Rhizohabitans arisaemae]
MTSTLLYGGAVHTLGDAGETHEAILLRDGKVAAVGRHDELRPHLGRDGTAIDLRGLTAMPGLVDIHPHLIQHAGQMAAIVDLTDAVDHDDIVRRIAERAATTPPGTWIVTSPVGEPFYFIRRSYRDLKERVLPDRHILDRATDRHPVLIQAWAPVTPNICAFNTAGLRAVGITDLIPDRVCDVWIDKDHNGAATGILRGSVNQIYNYDPFWTQILNRLPRPAVDLFSATRKAMATYNRRGVTTVYEPHNMTADYLSVYRHLHAERRLTTRVGISMEVEMCARPPFQPASMAEFGELMRRGHAELTGGDSTLWMVGLTLAASGGPGWPGHMVMPEPYADPYGRPTKGTAFISAEKIRAFAEYCLEHDIRANLLAAGYSDHEDVLGVLEDPELAGRIRGRHWIVQHAPLITEPQARRYRALGFDLTTCAGFSWAKGEIYGERMGRHVWRDLVPFKRLLDAGLDVACGSDWGPKNAFEQIQLAQTGVFAASGRSNASPDHTVDRGQAVHMWTGAGGRVLRRPGLGHLNPGAYGDLIVVDRDPLNCDIADLPGTEVELTLLGGEIVHNSGRLDV